MADAATTPGVTPGSTTSEFKQTKLATIVSVVATVVGVGTSFLTTVQASFPDLKWVSLALTGLGMIGTILATLGYQSARATVKAAAAGAAPTATPAAAAAELVR